RCCTPATAGCRRQSGRRPLQARIAHGAVGFAQPGAYGSRYKNGAALLRPADHAANETAGLIEGHGRPAQKRRGRRLLSLAQADLPDWGLLPRSYMTPVFSMGFAKVGRSALTTPSDSSRA